MPRRERTSGAAPPFASPDELKAFTHPLRVRLYLELAIAGEATASRLAQKVSAQVALVSYHLHQLAQHGYLEQVDVAGDRRERWWRLSDKRLTWQPSQVAGDPAAAEAGRLVASSALAVEYEKLQQALHRAAQHPDEWADASFNDSAVLRLSAEELAELHGELSAVIASFAKRHRTRSGRRTLPPDAATREVMVLLHGFVPD
ncbi:MAG: winged helix-turn-helix domain-containing protein [Motilibacteraceae bacterium]